MLKRKMLTPKELKALTERLENGETLEIDNRRDALVLAGYAHLQIHGGVQLLKYEGSSLITAYWAVYAELNDKYKDNAEVQELLRLHKKFDTPF